MICASDSANSATARSGVQGGARNCRRAPLAECVRGPTIWAPCCARNPRFVIQGASLLFDNKFLMLLPYRGHGIFGFSSNFTYFHPLSPLFTHSLLIFAACSLGWFLSTLGTLILLLMVY